MDISSEVSRFFGNLISRPEGVMAFRFILQPIVSSVFGVLDGIKDERNGRSPYLWTILSVPGSRRANLADGLSSSTKTIGLAIVLDVIYQVRTFHAIYPLEAVVIALLLGFIPYLLVRGPTARIARWWKTRSDGSPPLGK